MNYNFPIQQIFTFFISTTILLTRQVTVTKSQKPMMLDCYCHLYIDRDASIIRTKLI